MPSLPRRPRVVLELDLTVAPVEIEPDDPIGRLRSRSRTRLKPVLRALHEAGRDPRVVGLVVKVGRSALSWTTMQDLRRGVLAFRGSGKPTVAWAETFGDGGNGTADYVLASAFERIWLMPAGELALLGVASETTFLRGALDKLGVEPQLHQRREYKNAADRIMRTEFTPAHEEAVSALTGSIWAGAVEAVADGRSLTPEEVRALADRAPLAADDARRAGLVDALGHRDQVLADVRGRAGHDDAALLFADRWSPRRTPRLPQRHRRVVGLVEGHGAIVSGRSRGGAGGGRMGSDTVAAALRAAREDDAVAAVVFRVDSPGGSAVASDVIWREVVLTREAGKPVVVSMGALAASGGYYVACPADVIVAEPATLTGSIGVFGGKVVVADLLERLGLTTGAVSNGAASRMFSPRVPFSSEEERRIDAMLDRVYAEFVGKVAAGRGMTEEAVDAVARGRVWSGIDASGNGLVDELGGLRDAVALARSRAGLPADAPVRAALHVPPIARLGRPRSSEDPRAVTAGLGTGPLDDLLAGVGLSSRAVLLMPDIRLR
ncbi:signal peptide peptidase SppA [Jatrophihabitans sp. YIM 134969]